MKIEDILASVNDTDELLIGPGMINNCGSVFNKHWNGKSGLIVADTNTWNAAGGKLTELLTSEGIELKEPLIFEVPPVLHADYEYSEQIIERMKTFPDTILIAVGSGTINDLVKRASFELKRDYLCFGTAASMDGYCSSGAALGYRGIKMTMECPAPQVVMADTDILKTAPLKGSAAGYGDLASKYTAGADWIIADITGYSKIHKPSWDVVHLKLDEWLSGPELIPAGDPEALSRVFEGLNFCGLAMQLLGNSRAASGAEHLFSHIWEMSGHVDAEGERVSHGFQVSLGILCVTALMEEIFSRKASDIDIDKAIDKYPAWEIRAADVEMLMGGFPHWEEFLDTCKVKYRTPDQLKNTLRMVKNGWEDLKAKVWNKLPRYNEVKSKLKAAGCPVIPGEIDLPRETALETYAKAHCMRKRYTSLDLAFELGILDKSVQRIRDSGIYLR